MNTRNGGKYIHKKKEIRNTILRHHQLTTIKIGKKKIYREIRKKYNENKRKYDNETAAATLDWKRNVMRRWLMDEVTGPFLGAGRFMHEMHERCLAGNYNEPIAKSYT